MNVTGENVLRDLVKARRDGLYDQTRGTWLPDVARHLRGRTDGRLVSHAFRRLERAGLAERTAPGYAKPTARGVEVDGILDRITVARGGRFEGRFAAGITSSESHALR
jgi:hypothetical protein